MRAFIYLSKRTEAKTQKTKEVKSSQRSLLLVVIGLCSFFNYRRKAGAGIWRGTQCIAQAELYSIYLLIHSRDVMPPRH